MLEANYLTMLLKPNYEKFVDYGQDVLDKNLTIIYTPYTSAVLEIKKNAPAKLTRELAESSIVPKVIFHSLKNSILIILNFPKGLG